MGTGYLSHLADTCILGQTSKTEKWDRYPVPVSQS